MLTKKIIALFLTSTLLLSGCSQSVENITNNIADTVSFSSEEEKISESKILQNLPEGVFAFGINFTSAQEEKFDILLKAKKYLPPKISEELKATPFGNDSALNLLMNGVEYSVFVQPKKEELLFLDMQGNLEEILNSQVCVIAEGTIKNKMIELLLQVDTPDITTEEIEKKISEGYKKAEEELVNNKDKFSFIEIELAKNNDIFTVSLIAKACDEESKKSAQTFFDAVQNQDSITTFISIDKAFLHPFLAKGNLSIIQTAYIQGRKVALAEAKKAGFEESKIEELEKIIIEPLQQVNIVKMVSALDKISYVAGPLSGNLFDRHSELVVSFTDESMAELFAEIQEGKIPQSKLWLNDTTKYTASVEQDGLTVYDYSSFQNTEYPSAMAYFGGSGALAGVMVIGVLAAGATAIYSGAQQKARDAVQQNDIQMIRTALAYAQGDSSDGLYPNDKSDIYKYLDGIPEGELIYTPNEAKTEYMFELNGEIVTSENYYSQ